MLRPREPYIMHFQLPRIIYLSISVVATWPWMMFIFIILKVAIVKNLSEFERQRDCFEPSVKIVKTYPTFDAHMPHFEFGVAHSKLLRNTIKLGRRGVIL